jgi:hypothetical protein
VGSTALGVFFVEGGGQGSCNGRRTTVSCRGRRRVGGRRGPASPGARSRGNRSRPCRSRGPPHHLRGAGTTTAAVPTGPDAPFALGLELREVLNRSEPKWCAAESGRTRWGSAAPTSRSGRGQISSAHSWRRAEMPMTRHTEGSRNCWRAMFFYTWDPRLFLPFLECVVERCWRQPLTRWEPNKQA